MDYIYLDWWMSRKMGQQEGISLGYFRIPGMQTKTLFRRRRRQRNRAVPRPELFNRPGQSSKSHQRAWVKQWVPIDPQKLVIFSIQTIHWGHFCWLGPCPALAEWPGYGCDDSNLDVPWPVNPGHVQLGLIFYIWHTMANFHIAVRTHHHTSHWRTLTVVICSAYTILYTWPWVIHSHSQVEQTVPSQNASQRSPSQRLRAAQSLRAPWFCLRGCKKRNIMWVKQCHKPAIWAW